MTYSLHYLRALLVTLCSTCVISYPMTLFKSFLYTYLVLGFVSLDFNPMNYTTTGRVGLLVACCTVYVLRKVYLEMEAQGKL